VSALFFENGFQVLGTTGIALSENALNYAKTKNARSIEISYLDQGQEYFSDAKRILIPISELESI
jgi:hypothetical protein